MKASSRIVGVIQRIVKTTIPYKNSQQRTEESEIEGTKELKPYKTEDEIVYESQVLFSALKEGKELPPQKRKTEPSKIQ